MSLVLLKTAANSIQLSRKICFNKPAKRSIVLWILFQTLTTMEWLITIREEIYFCITSSSGWSSTSWSRPPWASWTGRPSRSSRSKKETSDCKNSLEPSEQSSVGPLQESQMLFLSLSVFVSVCVSLFLSLTLSLSFSISLSHTRSLFHSHSTPFQNRIINLTSFKQASWSIGSRKRLLRWAIHPELTCQSFCSTSPYGLFPRSVFWD